MDSSKDFQRLGNVEFVDGNFLLAEKYYSKAIAKDTSHAVR